MKKIIPYLSKHGFIVMMAGFVLAIGGVLVYMQTRYAGTSVPHIAFGVTVFGFIIYVTGRVLVAVERRQTKKPPQQDEINS